MLRLRLGQLASLLPVVDPRPALAVRAALFQADVPHCPAYAGDPLSVLDLLVGELNLKPPTRQHHSTVLLRLDLERDARIVRKVTLTTDNSRQLRCLTVPARPDSGPVTVTGTTLMRPLPRLKQTVRRAT